MHQYSSKSEICIGSASELTTNILSDQTPGLVVRTTIFLIFSDPLFLQRSNFLIPKNFRLRRFFSESLLSFLHSISDGFFYFVSFILELDIRRTCKTPPKGSLAYGTILINCVQPYLKGQTCSLHLQSMFNSFHSRC